MTNSKSIYKTSTLTSAFLTSVLFIFLFASCEKELSKKEKNQELTSLSEGLLGHWDFNGNAMDKSGNGYHGILRGPELAEDRFGDDDGAYDFNGTSDYIDLGNITELGLGGFQPYAISTWVNAGSTGGTVISKWNGAVSAGWYLRLREDNMLWTSYRNVVPWIAVSADQGLTNTWQNVITQYDGKYLYIYVDGELQSRALFTSQPHDKKTPVLIGALHSRNEVTTFFNGRIDDIRLFNRVLSDEEILWLASH